MDIVLFLMFLIHKYCILKWPFRETHWPTVQEILPMLFIRTVIFPPWTQFNTPDRKPLHVCMEPAFTGGQDSGFLGC